jgi:glycosyltransferase involved in cell wall biosynthesis
VPLVTVLLPVFNAGRYVATAVESVLAQTFTDFELLVVDDGSTDGSMDIVDRFRDPRVRVIRNERHLGFADALNVGLREARAGLVARQDADDLSAPRRLERQVAVFGARPDLALLGTQGWVIEDDGSRSGAVSRSEHPTSIRWYALVDNPFIHTSVMFRRSVVWDDLGGYDPSRGPVSEDYALWSRVIARHPVLNLPDRLVTYRVNSSSMTAQLASGLDSPARRAFETSVRDIVAQNVSTMFGDIALEDDARLLSSLLLGLPVQDVGRFLETFWRMLALFERQYPEARSLPDFHRTLARQYDALAYRLQPFSRGAAARIYAAAIARDRAVARYLPWTKAAALTLLGPGGRARGRALRTRVASFGRHAGADAIRVAWVTYDSYPDRKQRFGQLDPATRMRAGNIGEWINRHAVGFRNEIYRPGERYDIVIFHKMMNERCQEDARGIQARGGKVVFNANVNYYEIWGDYLIPGTRPTDEQQRDALAMTRLADWVVADSTYLADVIRKITPNVTHVPDNVNLDVYRAVRTHGAVRPVTLIWSGVAKKAAHLLLIEEVLAGLAGIELLLVSDGRPGAIDALERRVKVRWLRFGDRRYARELAGADVIISPKHLCNGYELGHTEYKITLGMAAGLPAVASPQQSYVEAICWHGGGMIADGLDEWRHALQRLIEDEALRADLGARARRTVVERYSTPVVAQQYLRVLERLAAPADVPHAAPSLLGVPR